MQTWFYFLIFIITVCLTVFLRNYALKRNITDMPNERSSHSVPTPRGGGVSIVISFLITLALFTYFDSIDYQFGMIFLFSSAVVAIIGFVDDHGHVEAKWRLFIHSISAFAVVYGLGGLPFLNLFGFELDLGMFGYLFATIAVIWILNLFNFMDGIDGIASIEAITATFFSGLYLSYISPGSPLVSLHWLLAASICGFLVLNFPPAKVFMGDSGSGFLGFMLAALTLASAHEDQSMLWIWLVLLGVFIVDATFTLINRVIKKERVHEAHCSHAYQFASRKYNSHFKISMAVFLINLLWLAPIAYLISLGLINGAFALVIAYCPLVLLSLKFKAGDAANQKMIESNI